MKYFLMIVVLGLMGVFFVNEYHPLFAQAPPSGAGVNVYQPTPDQAKDLKIAQLTKAVSQQQAQSAINQYNAAVNDEMAVANKIKADNKWPDAVTYSVQTGAYSAPPPTPASGNARQGEHGPAAK